MLGKHGNTKALNLAPGSVACNSFPYCSEGMLHGRERLYGVEIELSEGDIVGVVFTAFGRGGFRYAIGVDPQIGADGLVTATRSVDATWADGSLCWYPWFSLWTSGLFRISRKGTYEFFPVLEKATLSGMYAVYHQSVVARKLNRG